MDEKHIDLPLWKDRFEAINATINDYLQQTSFASQENSPFKNLLKCLQAFAKDQFNFFYDGFGEQKRFKLDRSRVFHPDYVFKVTLEQIAIDLELIRRAAEQRVFDLDHLITRTLNRADKLAWLALRPVVGAGRLITDETTTVITYFQKDASVRIIPYASVALIGIPYTARTVPRDFMAIPHEVGHYVYRHGRLEDGTPLAKELDWCLMEMGRPKWVRKWREEIFADVYSVLVGGPLMALTGQDLALYSSLNPYPELSIGDYHIFGEFVTDDGEHPVPAVRPSIYTKTLDAMGLKSFADKLNERWVGFPEVQEVTAFRPHYSNTGFDEIDVETGQKAVKEVTEAVLEDLPDPHSDVWVRWSGDPDGDVEPVEGLYGGFRERLDELVAGVEVPKTLSASPADDELAALWTNWIKKEQFFPGFPAEMQPPPPPTKIEPGKPSKLEYLEQEPRYTWIHILLGNGWATKVDNHSGG